MAFGSEYKKRNFMDAGPSTELMEDAQFCFSCEQIFSSSKFLEEHICPAASFICSCGTEFAFYKDMQIHSTTHEPGHQMLDHQTIKKRRIAKHNEEREKLKRLQSGEVVWDVPKTNKTSQISLPMKTPPQTIVPQVPRQSVQISQVPGMYPTEAPAGLLPHTAPTQTNLSNSFGGVGAPTVDLWTLFQPVVLLGTFRKFNKTKPYTCGKCGQCFMSKMSLVSHHSSHVADKIAGCIGCGLLLSSRKLVPRLHTCNSPSGGAKFKLITARPLSQMMPTAASLSKSMNLSPPSLPVTSSPMLQSQNLSAASKSSAAFNVPLTRNIKPLNPLSVMPVTMRTQARGPSPSASAKFNRGNHVIAHSQLKPSARPVFGVPNNQTGKFSNSYPCRVCHIYFDSTKGLQRHKCIKAQEFMAKQAQSGRHPLQRQKQLITVATPSPMNREQIFGVPSSTSIIDNQSTTVGLDKSRTPGVTVDDDCYIVESGPDKSAEMIYQVTSSVPIKI